MPERIAVRPPARGLAATVRRDRVVPAAAFGPPRPGGGGFSGPGRRLRRRVQRPGGGFGGPRPGEGGAPGAPRGRDFGPPAPPKGKKGAKPGFKKDENRPRGPIPTKFTGRMYDLDDVQKEEEGEDVIPDFMKPEDIKPDEGDGGGDEEI